MAHTAANRQVSTYLQRVLEETVSVFKPANHHSEPMTFNHDDLPEEVLKRKPSK